jgi:protein involved in polysaccharide export with SLBB domain
MKNLFFAAPALIATLAITTSGQVKSVAVANNQAASKSAATNKNPTNGTRVRVLGQGTASAAPAGNLSDTATTKSTAKADFNNHSETSRIRRANPPAEKREPSPRPVSAPSNVLMASTQVYRVGPNDVLDIQLAGNSNRNSTLFTVLSGGMLEYPLAGDPVPVVGRTTAEIASLLRQRIKVFENPSVVVNVRDYASHTVSITGFVSAPGTKALRREAVPLYAVLAEVVALPEAARATITRPGRPTMVLDLKDSNHSSTLVVPGDVIKVLGEAPPPSEFFFVGEGLNSPGQKPYHAELTLTQAILASGGVKMSSGSRVRISRQRADGRLANEDYDLRKIQSGKIPDPTLQKGDRIEVIGSN